MHGPEENDMIKYFFCFFDKRYDKVLVYYKVLFEIQ